MGGKTRSSTLHLQRLPHFGTRRAIPQTVWFRRAQLGLDPGPAHYKVMPSPKGTSDQHDVAKCIYCGDVFSNGQPKRNLTPHILVECQKTPEMARMHTMDLKGNKRQKISVDDDGETPFGPAEYSRLAARSACMGGVSYWFFGLPAYRESVAYLDRGLDRSRQVRPPSSWSVGGKMLDEIYDMEKPRVVEHIKEHAFVGLVADGWTNPAGASIMNFMVTAARMRPVFWPSIDTQDASHTSTYIASQPGQAIDEVEEAAAGCTKVCAVVTDSASNMVGAWEIIEHQYPGVLCHGCAAHVMALLINPCAICVTSYSMPCAIVNERTRSRSPRYIPKLP